MNEGITFTEKEVKILGLILHGEKFSPKEILLMFGNQEEVDSFHEKMKKVLEANSSKNLPQVNPNGA